MVIKKSNPGKRKEAVHVGDLLPDALRSLGVPSLPMTKRIHDAWNLAADPTWLSQARPLKLSGGVLVVGVSSSSLRDELAQFHRQRLLDVLKAALPDVVLVNLNFTTDIEQGQAGAPRTDPR